MKIGGGGVLNDLHLDRKLIGGYANAQSQNCLIGGSQYSGVRCNQAYTSESHVNLPQMHSSGSIIDYVGSGH